MIAWMRRFHDTTAMPQEGAELAQEAVDSAGIMAALDQLAWPGCTLVFALSGANYAVRFERWRTFLTRLGRRLPLGRHLLYYLSGFAYTVSPAKAGEAVRSLHLRGFGVSYAQSTAALDVERLQDLMAMVLLASLIVSDRPPYRSLVVGALLQPRLLILGPVAGMVSWGAEGLGYYPICQGCMCRCRCSAPSESMRWRCWQVVRPFSYRPGSAEWNWS